MSRAVVSLKHSTITGCLFSAAAWVLFAASPASAATITFSDPTLFQTTLGPAYLEDFNSLDIQAVNLNAGDVSFAGGPGGVYTYSVATASSPAGNSVYVIDNQSCAAEPGSPCWTSDITAPGIPGHNQALSTFVDASSLVFTFGSGIDAVGGSFFLTDANGVLAAGALTLTLSDGTQQILNDAGPGGFSGFISSADIGSLTVSTDIAGLFVTVDNMYVATPEPASMALILSGLAAGVFLISRKRNV
jgi:hypothetical protein